MMEKARLRADDPTNENKHPILLPMLITFASMLVGMFLYEWLKQIIFPDITKSETCKGSFSRAVGMHPEDCLSYTRQ